MTSTEPRGSRTGDSYESRGPESLLTDVVRVARKRRWLVAGVVALAVLISLGFNVFHTPAYRAEAVVSVQPREELGGVQGMEDLPGEVLNTVSRKDLLEEAVERAGWNAGVSEFEERLDVEEFTGRYGRGGLNVRFSWTDAEETARAANAYAEVFVQRAERFGEERFAGGTLAADVSLQSKAQTPPGGYWTRVLSSVGISVFAGLLAGVAAAFGLEGRGRGWNSVRDVEIALKVPVVGVVPEYPSLEWDERP